VAPGKIFSGPGAIGSTAPGFLKNHVSKLIKKNKSRRNFEISSDETALFFHASLHYF
jgi:hypothetical protein